LDVVRNNPVSEKSGCPGGRLLGWAAPTLSTIQLR
jgi:hypothetical protein